MTQAELSLDAGFKEVVYSSQAYTNIKQFLKYPLAYRILKFPECRMLKGGDRIGSLKLKYKRVFIQISGSSRISKDALFVDIGKIEDYSKLSV